MGDKKTIEHSLTCPQMCWKTIPNHFTECIMLQTDVSTQLGLTYCVWCAGNIEGIYQIITMERANVNIQTLAIGIDAGKVE